jgi:hypothetical protein
MSMVPGDAGCWYWYWYFFATGGKDPGPRRPRFLRKFLSETGKSGTCEPAVLRSGYAKLKWQFLLLEVAHSAGRWVVVRWVMALDMLASRVGCAPFS